MCVGIGGFGNEIRGRAARGEDFSKTVETNRNVETIRGRCMMMVEVWGGLLGDGRWGPVGLWIILWRRVTSYPPSTAPKQPAHGSRGSPVAMAALHIFLLSVFAAILLVLVSPLQLLVWALNIY